MGPSGTGVYDKEDGDQQERPQVSDQRPVDADSLRGFEEDMAGSKASKIADNFNRNAEGKPKNSASPENLLNAEKGVGGSGAGPIAKDGGLFSGKKGDMLLNGAGGALGAQAKSFMQKHRKKFIIAGASGIGVMPIIGLILFFIGLLALPNYAENIAARQFAKVTRAAQKSANNLMREKTAIASLTDDDHARAKSKYSNLKSKTFERIDRFRPNKIIQNLEGQNRIQYHYEKTKLGRERLVGITFSDDGGKTRQNVRIDNPGFFDRTVHPVRTLQNRLDTQRQIASALNEAIKLNNPKVPTAVRAVAVKNYMKNKLGVSLKGLVASKYLGKNDREARMAVQQESYGQVKDKNGANGFTNQELKEATNDANAAEEKCVQDPKCLGKTVDNPGEIPPEVADEIDKRVNPNRLSTMAKVGNAVVGAINPIYDIALPVCLVYDGSRLAPESVDARSNEAQRTGALVMATADQQRQGTAVNGEMIGAMNWKLGDTNQSNALKRAQGEQVNTLANSPSTQATPFGGYGEVTIFNVLLDGLSPDVANSFNTLGNNVCPTVTNIWFGVGVGVVNVVVTGVASFFTGGGAAAGEIAATQAMQLAVKEGLKLIVKKVVTSFTTKAGFKAMLKFGYKEVQFWGAVELATYLAKILVGMHSFTGNGLAVGTSFANDADNGANQLGNSMMRVNYGGRALTDTEALESMAEDDKTIAQMNAEKSVFDRYFAFDNPNSMMTRVGMSLNTTLTTNMAGSMLTKVSSIFNPLTAAPKIFGSLNQKVVYAAEGDVDSQVYGNVQFGWTKAELDLIDKIASYSSPSENEYQLDQRGDRDKIESEYKPCLDETIGKILGEKWLERNNETGDVAVDKGKCSPKNMGPNNPDYGDGVFRYRLLRFYEASLTTLEGIENPVEPGTEPQGTDTGTPGTIPNGTAQELAKQILASDNIRFQLPEQRTAMEYIAQTGKGRQCGAPNIDPKLLGVILAISQKYKIVIGVLVDGHDCNGGFHPKGKAVDINGANPLNNWNGGTGDHIRWTSSEMSILKPFYDDIGQILKSAGGGGMGQIQCFKSGTTPNKASSVTYFDDTCHHLHVDLGKR